MSTSITPFFSLIVPVYNVEKYLNQCVDSIINQDFRDFEIILINDGSKDNCGFICDDYAKKDNRIKVFHQKNGGLSAARNSGIKIAKGKYIWFIDSDDWIKENSLSILEKHLLINDLEVVSFTFTFFYEKENKFSAPKNLNPIEKTNGNDFVLNPNSFFHGIWLYVFNKSFIDKYNLLFKEQQLIEDDYFNINCFGKINSISKIPYSLYNYRQREGSIMNDTSIANLLHKINSYLNLMVLCNEVDDFNKNFILILKEHYIDWLYQLINLYCAKESIFKIKYGVLKMAKNAMGNLSITKSDIENSKLAVITKVLFNLNIILFVLYSKILNYYYKLINK